VGCGKSGAEDKNLALISSFPLPHGAYKMRTTTSAYHDESCDPIPQGCTQHYSTEVIYQAPVGWTASDVRGFYAKASVDGWTTDDSGDVMFRRGRSYVQILTYNVDTDPSVGLGHTFSIKADHDPIRSP